MTAFGVFQNGSSPSSKSFEKAKMVAEQSVGMVQEEEVCCFLFLKHSVIWGFQPHIERQFETMAILSE